jgi:sugar lactone lactonase YvrE
MRYTPDLLQKKPFVFPESPRWFHDSFYFCDIDAGTLYRIGSDGTAEAIYVHGSPVSGWVRLDDGSLLVVAGLERRIVSVRDGLATTFADATGRGSRNHRDARDFVPQRHDPVAERRVAGG